MARFKSVNRGDTFFADHLHIVCSNPSSDGSVVVFNATTPKRGSDRSCVLQSDDHPALTRESVILYERGRIYTKAEQDQLEGAALFVTMRRALASLALVRRIQHGAIASNQAAIEIKEIMREEVAQQP